METHNMKLFDYAFDEVRDESKLIEIRLFDEKRQKVSLGDIIRFHKLPKLDETIDAEVMQIKKYDSWKELVDDTSLKLFGPRWTSKKDLHNTELNYSSEQQNKYGFVVFYIQRTSQS